FTGESRCPFVDILLLMNGSGLSPGRGFRGSTRCLLLPWPLAFAATGEEFMPGIVDVHHHIMEPKFLELQQARIAASGYAGAELQKWTPSWSIEEMDKAGAEVAFLSISTPGSWTGDVQTSRKLARSINDYKAQIVRDHAKRFGFF